MKYCTELLYDVLIDMWQLQMSATNRFLVISILLPQPQNANIMTSHFTEMSYLLKVMTYYGNNKVINWPKHYTLYTKLMVSHSSFHIWFGFSCTPKIEVVRAVFTHTTRSIFSCGTFSLDCAIFVVESRWLGKNVCNYLTIRRSRKTKPDMKTRMNNHQFGIQFVVFWSIYNLAFPIVSHNFE